MYMCVCIYYRKQEEESLKAAIALSEAEVGKDKEEEATEQEGGNLLQDFSTTGQ